MGKNRGVGVVKLALEVEGRVEGVGEMVFETVGEGVTERVGVSV